MRPCPFRQVTEEGVIFCEKITAGPREVTPEVCGRCPVAAIACDHLRFTLEQVEPHRLVVRYGNGREEVWEEGPARVEFIQAACAARVMPIAGPRDCQGCALWCGTQWGRLASAAGLQLVERRPAAAAAPRPRPAAGQRGRVIPFPTVSVASSQ